jgi:16S rRNA processing protein RimM
MEAAHLAVARFRKPHGLKGEALIVPLTDEPDEVFTPGRVLVPVDESGHPTGDELVLERARPFQRCWLLAFQGITERGVLEAWPQLLLGARREELRAPEGDEIYHYEIPGCAVVEDGKEIAVARDLVGVPGGELLVAERNGRELLIPFREAVIRRIDRAGRRIEVELPPGLLEV